MSEATSGDVPLIPKNAWHWYLDAWRNFGNFEGRSQRAAYWHFSLVHLIVVFICVFLDVGLFRAPVLTALYGLAAVIPGLSLSVRRLHDAGRSGWWLLVGVVPAVGQVAVLNPHATSAKSISCFFRHVFPYYQPFSSDHVVWPFQVPQKFLYHPG